MSKIPWSNTSEIRFFKKMIFQGQRDQVYLFRNHAFIGKSDFQIDSSVIHEFEKLLSEV